MITRNCKQCNITKKLSTEFFYKDRNGFQHNCKMCVRIQHYEYRKNNKQELKIRNRKYCKNNKQKIKIQKSKYYEENKQSIKVRDTDYYRKNKQKINIRNRKYYENNKQKSKARDAEYYKKNKQKIKIKDANYYKKNKQKILEYGKKQNQQKATYISMNSLILYENIKKDPINNVLGQIECKYCGRWHNPTNSEVMGRQSSINGLIRGSCYIYCSQQCKDACPTFKKIAYEKDKKQATSREVNPYIRKLCFEKDKYTCQKCNSTEKELHCHHIEGAAKEPLLANDIDNVITFCKECHKIVHSEDGCHYSDYQRPVCK